MFDRVDEIHHSRHNIEMNGKVDSHDSSKQYEECKWGSYARGALYALHRKGNRLFQVRNMTLMVILFTS